MTTTGLANLLDLSAPTVSQHLRLLRTLRLVRTRREGQQVYYFLNTTVLEDLLAIIWDLFAGRDGRESKS